MSISYHKHLLPCIDNFPSWLYLICRSWTITIMVIWRHQQLLAWSIFWWYGIMNNYMNIRYH